MHSHDALNDVDRHLGDVADTAGLENDLRFAFLPDSRTAFALPHDDARVTLREIAAAVEVDGAHFGHVKPTNYFENRKDRRLAKNQNGKRRVVVVMRERRGRTVPFVVRREHEAVPVIERRVRLDSIIHADEALGWGSAPRSLQRQADQPPGGLQP